MRLLPWNKKRSTATRDELVRAIIEGKRFIYPTDTIYGIGCNALVSSSVRKIRAIKKRDANKPFSVIAPNKKWVRENTRVRFPSYLKKLPGGYTLLLPKKNKSFLSEVSSSPVLGVRMIDHPFQSLVTRAGVPFVTTSVNVSGEPFARKIDDISLSIQKKVDYVLDAGTINGSPSTLIDLTGKKPIIHRRN